MDIRQGKSIPSCIYSVFITAVRRRGLFIWHRLQNRHHRAISASAHRIGRIQLYTRENKKRANKMTKWKGFILAVKMQMTASRSRYPVSHIVIIIQRARTRIVHLAIAAKGTYDILHCRQVINYLI